MRGRTMTAVSIQAIGNLVIAGLIATQGALGAEQTGQAGPTGTEGQRAGEAAEQAGTNSERPHCPDWNTKEFFATANAGDVEACLAAGADVESRDFLGMTALHRAAELNESLSVTQALLASDADPKVLDNGGRTPMHRSARWNANATITKVLLAAGADADAQDSNGYTPLHLAAGDNANAAVTQALLDAAARTPTRRPGNGK